MADVEPSGVDSTFGGYLPLSVKSFGAKGDVKSVADAAMTAASAVLTSATAGFAASDVGKIVQVTGAGAAVTPTGTTSNVTNPTLITAMSSVAGIVPGTLITGAGIPSGTIVVGIVSTTIIRISKSATAAAVGVTLTISGSISGTISGFTSASSVTISVTATTSVTAATVRWGTDDTAAFTAAVAAWNAVGVGDLYVPGGAYYDGGNHTVTASGTMFGDGLGAVGFGSTVMLKPGANVDQFTFTQLLTTVRDLGFDGNYAVQTGGTGRCVVYSAFGFNAHRLFIANSTGDRIVGLTGATGADFQAVRIRNCQGFGLVANDVDNDYAGVNVGLSGLSGVSPNAGDQTFTQLHSWGNGTLGTAGNGSGVRQIGAIGVCRYINCNLETNNDRGFHGPSVGAAGPVFVGGEVWGNRNAGIYCNGYVSAIVNGTAVFNNGQSGAAGVTAAGIVNDGGTYWSVTGTNAYDDQATKTQTFAYFEVNATDHNTLTGNTWPAARHKTGSTTLIGANNIPAAASIGTLNVVV